MIPERPARSRAVNAAAAARSWPTVLRSLFRAVPAVLPDRYAELDELSLVASGPLAHPGLDLAPEPQLALLAEWARGPHQELFASIRSDPAINTHGDADGIQNGQYPTPDAEIYAALVLDRAPARILEIGSGFSTLIARRAIEFSAAATELVVVDPEPRTDIRAVVDAWHQTPVEALDPDSELFRSPGLLLFIDSSHVVRAGGDVPFLFNQIVPALPAGSLVHVHDVFLPYEYPDAYKRRLYGEQYLLAALLAHSGRFRVVFATHHMLRAHPEQAREAFGPRAAADPTYLGASVWFRVE